MFQIQLLLLFGSLHLPFSSAAIILSTFQTNASFQRHRPLAHPHWLLIGGGGAPSGSFHLANISSRL